MKRMQVVISKNDREWDRIRERADQAMYSITEDMKKDYDPDVARIGDLVQWKLIFGKGAIEGSRVFEEHGFTVHIKEINDEA